MDINALKQEAAQDEEGAVIEIMDKNGEPYTASDGSAVTITVRGLHAKAVRAAMDANQRRLLKAGRRKLEPSDIQRNRIEQAAAAVVEWRGWEANGEPFPCTPENVRALLGTPWILDQVEAGIESHAGFFVKS